MRIRLATAALLPNLRGVLYQQLPNGWSADLAGFAVATSLAVTRRGWPPGPAPQLTLRPGAAMMWWVG